jgi:outer membrane immunogenic protein
MRSILLSTAALIALASQALAADLPTRKEAPSAPVAPAFNWTGFYGGLDVGVGANDSRWDNSADPNNAETNGPFDVNSAAFLAGGFAGYNYQINNFVLGVEGSVSYVGLNSDSSPSLSLAFPLDSVTIKTKQDWLGSADAKLGYAIDRIMLYAVGGVAFTDYGLSEASDLAGTYYGHNAGLQSRTGWDAGLGLDYAITDRWIVGAEWKYYDFGMRTFNTGPSATNLPAGPGFDFVKVGETENNFTARIAYKF